MSPNSAVCSWVQSLSRLHDRVCRHEQATAYRKPTRRLPRCALAPVYSLVCSSADRSQQRGEPTLLPRPAPALAPFLLAPWTQPPLVPPARRWRTSNRKEGSDGNPPPLGVLLVLVLEPGELRRVPEAVGARNTTMIHYSI